MKKTLLFLTCISLYYCSYAVEKTITIRNRTESVVTISVQDFQGKVYNQELTCDAATINTNVPKAQLKMTIDIPAKSWTELVTGRNYFKAILVNKNPLLQADLADINKQVASLIEKSATGVTIYLHRRPSPESWGDWGKNYIKETIGSYLGQSSKAPNFPYELQFIKENGTNY